MGPEYVMLCLKISLYGLMQDYDIWAITLDNSNLPDGGLVSVQNSNQRSHS